MQNLSREYGGVFQQAARVSEVCFDSIESAIAHNNSPESLLRGKVRKGLTVAVEAANPGLVYTSLPGSLKQGPDEAIYFHLSFFAKVVVVNRDGKTEIKTNYSPVKGDVISPE